MPEHVEQRPIFSAVCAPVHRLKARKGSVVRGSAFMRPRRAHDLGEPRISGAEPIEVAHASCLLLTKPYHMTQRIVIAGGPRTGKSTYAIALAARSGAKVMHTDDLIGKTSWSEASTIIAAAWFSPPGPWFVEGVAVARALRKWLASHPTGKPCDVVVYMRQPFVALTPGQATMAKGCETVWDEIRITLIARGVVLQPAIRLATRGAATGR